MPAAPKPIVGPTLKSASPSQIRTFRACKRKHWLDKRAGIKQPQGPDAEVGEKVHKVLEDYYGDGVAVDPAAAAADVAPELQAKVITALRGWLQSPDVPRYEPGLLVETPRNYNMSIAAAPGIEMRGRIDLVIPPKAGVTTVVDHKTSKHTRYRKSPEELGYDIQGIVYGKYAFERIPGTEAVVFAHNALCTETVDADYIPTDPMSRETINERYAEHVTPVAVEMAAHFTINDFDATTPNFDACEDFGGCPYAAICGVTLRKDRNKAMDESKDEAVGSFKERLAAKKRAEGINPPDAAPPLPVTPYVPPGKAPGAPGAVGQAFADLERSLGALKAALAAAGVQ